MLIYTIVYTIIAIMSVYIYIIHIHAQTKQVMHKAIAHHLPTDVQSVPEQRLPPSQPIHLRFMGFFAGCHIRQV